MDFEDKLEMISDALYHIDELIDTLKKLGRNYLNTVDILSDIYREVEIDEAITEQRLNEQYEREQQAMLLEYQRSVL